MAPSVWNSLLATLRNVPTLSQFKSHLKTYLFAQAFQYNLALCLKKGGMSVYGLLNADKSIWIEGEGRSGGGGVGGGVSIKDPNMRKG